MFVKKNILISICLALWLHTSLPSIIAGTLVRTTDGYISVENVIIGNRLVTHNNASPCNTTVTQITHSNTNILITITTPKGIFYTCPDQLFYDPISAQWIAAQHITTQTTFLDYQHNHCPCLHVETIQTEPISTYRISTTAPHTFFITEQELLTHNALPLFIGFAWLFGQGLQFAGITIGTAFLGSYIGVQLYNGQKQKKKENNLNIALEAGSGGCLPDPDDDDDKNKERKFNTITKSEFFKKIKNDYEHYKNGIYRRKKGAKSIENAEYLQWDYLHGDVEAYAENRWHMGSIDPKNLRFYKPAVPARRLPK